MAKVYVSSTYEDLKIHRQKVISILRKAGHEMSCMEDYPAFDKRPPEKCCKDIEECDIYVGIFAWRYGHIPDENNPKRKSITELEYDTARSKIRLIFLLDEKNATWDLNFVDSHTGHNDKGSRIRGLSLSNTFVTKFLTLKDTEDSQSPPASLTQTALLNEPLLLANQFRLD